MKNRTTILNTSLAAVLGVVLLASIVAKTMCPQLILPQINIPYVAAISLVALVITSFVKTEEGCIYCEMALAALTFGLLPLAAGMLNGAIVVKFALCGGIVFGVLDLIVNAMTKRIEVAGICKCAVIPSAFVLYLACQSFAGILL